MKYFTYDALNPYVSLIEITRPEDIHEELAVSRLETHMERKYPKWFRILLLIVTIPFLLLLLGLAGNADVEVERDVHEYHLHR